MSLCSKFQTIAASHLFVNSKICVRSYIVYVVDQVAAVLQLKWRSSCSVSSRDRHTDALCSPTLLLSIKENMPKNFAYNMLNFYNISAYSNACNKNVVCILPYCSYSSVIKVKLQLFLSIKYYSKPSVSSFGKWFIDHKKTTVDRDSVSRFLKKQKSLQNGVC